MKSNNKSSTYSAVLIAILIIAFYLSYRYMMLWTYQLGYGVQSNQLSNIIINMNNNWFPSLNTSTDNLYTKMTLYFSEGKKERKILIFKKPYITLPSLYLQKQLDRDQIIYHNIFSLDFP